MNKKILILCSMLLASSLSLKAVRFNALHVQMPIEFAINAEDPNNPLDTKYGVDLLNVKSDLNPGLKWAILPQVAVMFDPQDLSTPVVLVDVKRTFIKIIAKNPDIIQRSGIVPADFINAGISEEEFRKLQQENVSKEEIGLVAQILKVQVFSDLVNGGVGKGGEYVLNGTFDVLKGGSKIGLGSIILIKKALGALTDLLAEIWQDMDDSSAESSSEPEMALVKK